MNTRYVFILLFAVFLAGCETVQESEDEVAVEDQGRPVGETETGDTGEEGAQAYAAGEDSRSGISELDDPDSPLSVRVIYFEYDSSEVRPEYREIVEAHANYLANNPGTSVTLEGHADERGSREYNLALGERRAQAIQQQLTLLGASPGQIRTVSYGEERPAVDGHDESAYSQNRRVEIIY
ncbi:MAG TPA: peptidoglycan-associated lipoprotein Pal [Gammaproteobacteria bacterium]|nr:peptidoglycan-associated lipoprotein Pal [Gammaproteobacteria bacterium]